MTTNYDILGRDDVDDLDAILADHQHRRRRGRPRRRATTPTPSSPGTTSAAAPALDQALREGQDLAVERRDRPRLVDRGRPGRDACSPTQAHHAAARSASGIELSRHRRSRAGPTTTGSSSRWSARTGRLSQFMHGEQGALICTAKIVETVPWIDAKYYAATQVMDEARHVEVFAKYLDTKLDGHYPINPHLEMLLDDIIVDSRWDMTYLGHADHGRGPRPGRVRLHAPADHRAAAQAAAPLRDERRGPPRGLRRALAQGVLRASSPTPSCATARSSPSRPRCACATGSSSRRSGSGMGVDVKEAIRLVSQDDRDQTDVPAAAVLQDRAELQEARPARRQATAGSASASPSSASSSSRTGPTPARSTSARRGRRGPRRRQRATCPVPCRPHGSGRLRSESSARWQPGLLPLSGAGGAASVPASGAGPGTVAGAPAAQHRARRR